MVDHPAALKILTNAYWGAFSSNTVQLCFFYSDDDSRADAYHFYSDTIGLPDVFICVREKQSTLDQFITILFETLNSTGASQFAKLSQEGKAGRISKAEFARGILRVEFEAMKRTRDLLLTLKLSKKETRGSDYYSNIVNCPAKFDDFLPYIRKASRYRNAYEEYELKYDSLRKAP